jgi:uncharacterized protein YdhG (YjbR/CyaY superfamily)
MLMEEVVADMTRRSREVDAYLAGLPAGRKQALDTLRALILERAPQATESMRYRMPTYDDGRVICAMASQKHYMSLYLDTEMVEKYSAALAHLNVGKSCVRFRKLEDLPLNVICQILDETLRKANQG